MISFGHAPKFVSIALLVSACGASTTPSERTTVRQVTDENATVTVTRGPEPALEPAALAPASGSSNSCLPEGVHVSSVPVDDGVRVQFTARADLVPRLRQLVSQIADEQNAALSAESAPDSRPRWFAVRGTAGAVESPGGATLILKPSDPDELEAFRDHVMQAVDALSSGRFDPCPIPPMPSAQPRAR